MAKPSPEQIKRRALASERHKARHFAMQGLYQWQLNATQANEISAQFNIDFNMKGKILDLPSAGGASKSNSIAFVIFKIVCFFSSQSFNS